MKLCITIDTDGRPPKNGEPWKLLYNETLESFKKRLDEYIQDLHEANVNFVVIKYESIIEKWEDGWDPLDEFGRVIPGPHVFDIPKGTDNGILICGWRRNPHFPRE